MEDLRSKRGWRGVWSPPAPGKGWRGDQLMLQVGGWGEDWKVDGCSLSTQNNGGAWCPHLVGGLVISSSSSLQLRVDVSKIRSR